MHAEVGAEQSFHRHVWCEAQSLKSAFPSALPFPKSGHNNTLVEACVAWVLDGNTHLCNIYARDVARDYLHNPLSVWRLSTTLVDAA